MQGHCGGGRAIVVEDRQRPLLGRLSHRASWAPAASACPVSVLTPALPRCFRRPCQAGPAPSKRVLVLSLLSLSRPALTRSGGNATMSSPRAGTITANVPLTTLAAPEQKVQTQKARDQGGTAAGACPPALASAALSSKRLKSGSGFYRLLICLLCKQNATLCLLPKTSTPGPQNL